MEDEQGKEGNVKQVCKIKHLKKGGEKKQLGKFELPGFTSYAAIQRSNLDRQFANSWLRFAGHVKCKLLGKME